MISKDTIRIDNFGFLCLTDISKLFGCKYKKGYQDIFRGNEFQKMVEYFFGIKRDTNTLLHTLKKNRLYYTIGKGNTKKSFCHWFIWYEISKIGVSFEYKKDLDSFIISLGYDISEIEYIRCENKFAINLELCTKDIIHFEKQFSVLNYRLDFYSKEYNLAVEYDEGHHDHKENSVKDKIRESEIKQAIKGITFIRVKKGKESEGINEIFKFILCKGK